MDSVNGHAEASNGGHAVAEREIPTYNDMFPALDKEAIAPAAKPVTAWKTSSIRPSVVVQNFSIAPEEQRKEVLGETNSAICSEVMSHTDTKVDVSRQKDGTLNFLVSGKRENVAKAIAKLQNRLQTQASVELHIPVEHHAFLIGRGGSRLKDLQEHFSTSIRINRDGGDEIRVTGTTENCRRCAAEIQKISDKQAQTDRVTLPFLKAYHTLIAGPDSATLKRIQEQTGVRVHMPPAQKQEDAIVVAGEKTGVARAVAELQAIYDEKRRTCVELPIDVAKDKHKYLGRGFVHDVMEKTGVVIEIPPLESSDSKIILRGPQQSLPLALQSVYEKADSMDTQTVSAPTWVKRHLMGKKGANISALCEGTDKVHLDFQSSPEAVVIEGPTDFVQLVKERVLKQATELQASTAYDELKVDPTLVPHLIGRQGATVARIKELTGVTTHTPSQNSAESIVRFEGPHEGVPRAKAMIEEIIAKQKNHSNVDVIIPQQMHSQIIGPGGKNIKEVIAACNGVQITFPGSSQKSDIITVRGNREDVREAEKRLLKLAKTAEEESYELEVPVFKEFYRNIIGRGGNTIRQLREETSTRINIPAPDSESNCVTIIGRQKNCEAARDRILAIQAEIANIVTEELDIDPKFHPAIMGPKRQIVASIQSECGVYIHFPASKVKGPAARVVTVRGPREDVAKATEKVMALANETALNNQSEEMQVPADKHRYIIGRGGATKNKIQDETGARIVIPPRSEGSEKNYITVIGTKEAVAAAVATIQARLKELENIVEATTDVDPKWYKDLTSRRRDNSNYLREISDEFGGVNIELPRAGPDGERSSVVKLKGPKEEVPQAIARIQEIIEDLEARVTVTHVIPQSAAASVMGPKGSNVLIIESDCNVSIKFPPRGRDEKPKKKKTEAEAEAVVDGEGAEEDVEEAATPDAAAPDTVGIQITGRPENCDKAIAAIQELIPTTETIQVPNAVHKHLKGNKGEGVRKLQQDFNVHLRFPDPRGAPSDDVIIRGLQEAIERFKKHLESSKAEFDDIILQGHREEVTVDPRHHRTIIGPKGSAIQKFRQDFGVEIDLPREGSGRDPNIIVITGYEAKAKTAAAALAEMAAKWDSYVDVDIDIDSRVHGRIIGARASGIRALQEKFKVQIKFPNAAKASSVVTVTGAPEDVDDACEELLALEDDLMQDVRDREEDTRYLKKQEQPAKAPPKQESLTMRDAPWDHADSQMFPTLGGGASATQAGMNSAWGSGKPAI